MSSARKESVVVNLINILYCAMKLLPYQDEAFSKYRMEGVQEFRFVLSGQIRPQVLNAIFVEKVETYIKSNAIINALKQRIVNIQLLQKYLSEKSPFDIFVRVISEVVSNNL